MSTLAGTDAFVVNRGGVNYQVTAANLMSTVVDTDLFVVNRGGVNFKITGLDVKSYLGSGGNGYLTAGSYRVWGPGNTGTGDDPVPSRIETDGTNYYMNTVMSSSNTPSFQKSTDGKVFSFTTNTERIYALVVAQDGSLVGYGRGASGTARGIYRSTDQGASWSLVKSLSSTTRQDTTSCTVADTGEIYFRSDGGGGYSLDNGATWLGSGTVLTTAPAYSFTNSIIVSEGLYITISTTTQKNVTVTPVGGGASTTVWTGLTGERAKSLAVTRGLSPNYLAVAGVNSDNDTSFLRSYRLDTFALVSSTLSAPYCPVPIVNWVPSINKLVASFPNATNTSSPNLQQAGGGVYVINNGIVTNVTTTQNMQNWCPSSFYEVGGELFSAVPGTPFIVSGWVL
jgi:hypothetical protein